MEYGEIDQFCDDLYILEVKYKNYPCFLIIKGNLDSDFNPAKIIGKGLTEELALRNALMSTT